MGPIICTFCDQPNNEMFKQCHSCGKWLPHNRKPGPPVFGVGENIGCGQCSQGRKTTALRLSQEFEEERKYLPSLRKISDLKFGSLYKCVNCNSSWLCGYNKKRLSFIQEDKMSLLWDWNKRTLKANDLFIKKLRQIGATPLDSNGNLTEYIRVPCKCTFADGQTFDLCMVSFSFLPPKLNYPDLPNIRFLDEVVDINESEFALSPEMRLKMSKAKEIRMGFEPTWTKTPDGVVRLFTHAQTFCKEGQFRGQDFSLPGNQDLLDAKEGKNPYVKNEIEYKDTIAVIGDLSPEVCDLRLEMPIHQRLFVAIMKQAEHKPSLRVAIAQLLEIDDDILVLIQCGMYYLQKWQKEAIGSFCRRKGIQANY